MKRIVCDQCGADIASVSRRIRLAGAFTVPHPNRQGTTMVMKKLDLCSRRCLDEASAGLTVTER